MLCFHIAGHEDCGTGNSDSTKGEVAVVERAGSHNLSELYDGNTVWC